MITKKCEECGKGFEVDETKRNWQHVILCSDECQKNRLARKKREKYVKQEWPQDRRCLWCQEMFTVERDQSTQKYCNRKCYLAKRSYENDKKVREQKQEKVCMSCGNTFIPAKHSGDRQKYCSKTCFRREMWEKHGFENRSSSDYNRIRKHILKEHDRTCILCGSKKKPQVHHLDNSRDDGDMNNSYDNLTVLCRKCHYSIHGVTVIKADNEWQVSGEIFNILGLNGTIKINPNY